MYLSIKLYLVLSLGLYKCQLGICSESFPGQKDEVTVLPGVNFALNYRHYAGYLESINQNRMFYWFFESQSGHPQSDPLVLWLNGGPGFSSLYGAFSELGPIRMELNGTLTENHFAWNQNSNVLFVESPTGVGFSYRPNTRVYITNDDETTKQNFGAVQSFFNKFPHFRQNGFFIAGESYAARYIPKLAIEVLKNTKFPLQGITIGNGLLDWDLNNKSISHFYYYHGLIDNLNATVTLNQIFQDIPYHNNIYKNCNTKPTDKPNDDLPSCWNSRQLEQWLNQEPVKRAIHVDESLIADKWTEISYKMRYTWGFGSMADDIKYLLENEIRVLIYNGDLDGACNFIGAKWFVEQLGYPTVSPYAPWYYSGYVGGFVKRFDKNLTFTTVRGAGHMVPEDMPGPALQMFNHFLTG